MPASTDWLEDVRVEHRRGLTNPYASVKLTDLADELDVMDLEICIILRAPTGARIVTMGASTGAEMIAEELGRVLRESIREWPHPYRHGGYDDEDEG